jgi:phosphatidylinositol alpha-1,6-mannosyltransferase
VRSRPGFLALGLDISGGNGIGAFTLRIIEGLGRIAPREPGTALALRAAPDLDLPEGWNLCQAGGRLEYAVRALTLALRNRPAEIIVLHVSLMPVASLAARLVSARLTLVAHGWELIARRRRLDRWCGYRVDQLVANSRVTALEMDRFFPKEGARRFGAVRLLYPPWDHRNSNADSAGRAEARGAFGLEHDELVLLTVGRMDASERYKGHDRVLAILPSLLAWKPTIRYLVVGEGDDRDRLAERTVELGVADRVTFAGYREDLAGCYAACDVYVMPSTHEGFGIVFLEALATGRPVVAGGIDGSIEAVGWGELAFLCDPLDPSSVEGAIRRAINAAGSSDPRVDTAFLRAQVERRFGRSAFDRRLAELFGRCTPDPFAGKSPAATERVD